MRSKLAKEVRREFETGLSDALPRFRRVTVPVMVPGYRVYQLVEATKLRWFLVLELPNKPYREQFTVSLYGTEQDEFPSYHMAIQDPDGQLTKGTIGFRIGRLFAGKKDYWWQVAMTPSLDQLTEGLGKDLLEPLDVCLARIPQLVRDCISKVHEYVVPYIRQWDLRK